MCLAGIDPHTADIQRTVGQNAARHSAHRLRVIVRLPHGDGPPPEKVHLANLRQNGRKAPLFPNAIPLSNLAENRRTHRRNLGTDPVLSRSVPNLTEQNRKRSRLVRDLRREVRLTDVYTNANDDAITLPFAEDARQLSSPNQHIVRPFYLWGQPPFQY